MQKKHQKRKSVTEDTELKWNLVQWDLDSMELLSYVKLFLVPIFFSGPSKT